jgi:hypothetical protein
MAICESHGWPEPLCRGHIQAATIELDQAQRECDLSALVRAHQHLGAAREIPSGMIVPDVEIAFQLASFKAELVRRDLDRARSLAVAELDDILVRVANLIEVSGLGLAAPELLAGRALLQNEYGADAAAHSGWERAIAECERQGNVLTATSPRSLVGWLGALLGRTHTPSASASRRELIPLIGSDLSSGWMSERLGEITALGESYSMPKLR